MVFACFAVQADVGNAGKASFAAGLSTTESAFRMLKQGKACAFSIVEQAIRTP